MKPSPAVQCPKCSVQNPPESHFCNSCGHTISSISQAPTATAESPAEIAAAAAPAPVGRLISSDSLPVGGFTPGMVLAGRYRIIGLIGRGGMGEVYRADDLKLGQPVALKFLPKQLADDAVRRERLFAEVRIARQVSHPNICRVYDIAELEGRHFLTMEYIDGEDLASLLKRIGNLHGAKALDVARQLCAGLAAAHDKGVLHRDLKPANVMIDGRGRVRITDFGLAVAEEEEPADKDVSGTPPYMAPEQFAGKGASVRSDIYALGLIFYEVFTGRRAFDAKTLAELRSKKETSSPIAPSEIARDIDPIVERVILRCVEKDPRQRPASAAQVAAALPGGDPLAAAIAAGETPSPEMVAASGSTEGLKPWIAWLCLACIILGIGTVLMWRTQFHILHRAPIERSPEVLEQTARDILRDIGYPDPPADKAYNFFSADRFLDYVEKNNKSKDRRQEIPALAIQFWYRQSPGILFTSYPLSTGVTTTDPSFTAGGESIVWMDSRGHLTGLRVIPNNDGKMSGEVSLPDWSRLFKAAGLDPAKFTAAQPELNPSVYADTRAAWTGTLPGFPGTTIRIEAAACQGKPVSWRMIFPEYDNYSTATLPSDRAQPRTRPGGEAIATFFILLAALPIFFARRNLRMGRGDRRGATRLALFIFLLLAVRWVFGAHHVVSYNEFFLFIFSASWWLLVTGWLWLIYIALEPFARRRWPATLVSWNRLLAGDHRDPLVGRDLLIGCTSAAAFAALIILIQRFQNMLGATQAPFTTALSLMPGFSSIFAAILQFIAMSIFVGLAAAFLVFVLQVLLKRTWAVGIVLILLLSLFTLSETPSLIAVIATALTSGLIVYLLYLLLRYGLLALIACLLFFLIILNFPFTTQLSAWYSGVGLTGLALLLAFALYAFHTSLASIPTEGSRANKIGQNLRFGVGKTLV
jgi:hypothetical protein